MQDNEILSSAIKFIENSAVIRNLDNSCNTETYRAVRDLHKINISSYKDDKILIIDSVQIRNPAIENAVWNAMKKRWMETADSDEKRLQKFRDDVNNMSKSMPGKVIFRENEREDRQRQK